MQKDLAPDIELSLKKRARRRLVGAIALVLILVALLPFLLKDRSVEVSNENVEISLQGNETPVYDTPPELPNDFDSSVVPATPAPDNKATQDQAVDLPAPKKEAKPTAEKVAEPVKAVKKETVKKQVEQPVEKKVAKKPAAVQKPKAQVAKVTEQAKPTAQADSFYIQIGAFSDAEKVKSLQTKMRELGYPSSTENVKTDKGTLIRLKSGKFSNRNEAMIALENMKDAGLSGMVRSQ